MNLQSDTGHILLALILLIFAVVGHFIGYPQSDGFVLAIWTFLFSKLDPKTTATLLGGPPQSINVPTPAATAGSGDTVRVDTHEVAPPKTEPAKAEVPTEAKPTEAK